MRRWNILLPAILCGIAFLFTALHFQAQGITGGDSGDLVTAAVTGGTPHPSGYPLYTLVGFILGKIPLFTPAWRVGLLSTIPHAASLILIFLIVTACVKKRSAAFLSVTVLASGYLFFYYSITPEVFALLDFFLLLLIYLFLQWAVTHKDRYFFLFVFSFFLSLSHHHLILFSVPAFVVGTIYVWRHNRSFFVFNPAKIMIGLALAGMGLLPYMYLPYARNNNPIIYWNKPDTMYGFLRVIRRADYGTFQSGGIYGELPIQRLLEVKVYSQFLLGDFMVIGIVASVVGFLIFWKRNRISAVLLGLLFISFGPFFFFYASFPLYNDFTLGTYERFLLPSYCILSIFIGIGIVTLAEKIYGYIKVYLRNYTLRKIGWCVIVVFCCLYPLRLFVITYHRTRALATDMTANNLGIDILNQAKPNAILILSTDSILFNTQYVRYALQVRPDTKVLHANGLVTDYYPELIRKVFPELTVPKVSNKEFIEKFIDANKATFPIYVNDKVPLSQGSYWVPKGLLFELTDEKNLPELDALASESARLFSQYHDPQAGALQSYKHFMLFDIQDAYASAYQQMGKIFLQGGKVAEAQKYFKQALVLNDDASLSDNYLSLGITQFLLNQCQEALDSFGLARKTETKENLEIVSYEVATYRECFKDEQKATERMNEYKKTIDEKENVLKNYR